MKLALAEARDVDISKYESKYGKDMSSGKKTYFVGVIPSPVIVIIMIVVQVVIKKRFNLFCLIVSVKETKENTEEETKYCIEF